MNYLIYFILSLQCNYIFMENIWLSKLSMMKDELYYQSLFNKYMKDYNKEYINLEYNHPYRAQKYNAFKNNLKLIHEHNDKYKRNEVTFALGLNHLADLTNEEYQTLLLGYKKNKYSNNYDIQIKSQKTLSEHNIPDSFDWREHNCVTPVKNQGMCGSCWAFSAVASMECVYAQNTGKLVSFSEQELVDCVLNGTDSCNHGGEMQDGFAEIIKHHSGKIDPESIYVYTGKSEGVCHADDSQAKGHFTNYVNVTSGDEDAVKEAVATKSVLSIAIDASSPFFQLYHHGVFNWPFCKNKVNELDHGVALVGYGTEKSHDYWLVKNSWSEKWGQDGYIKMSRNKNNQCGVATDASYPVMN